MYWPIGAPRIYASVKKHRRHIERPEDNGAENEDTDEASNSILGLRVARNGHLFATITETALIIWQTNVRNSDPDLTGSD